MEDSAQAAACEAITERGMYAGILRASKRLHVQDIMSKDVITASSTDAVQQAAQIMSENHISCLPITDDGDFKGILTQDEVLRQIASPGASSTGTTIAEQMRSDGPKISPDASVLDTSWFMEEAKIKWLPVLAEERLVGVVTQSDVTRALTSLVTVTAVATVMRREVSAVDAAATVSEAATVIAEEKISCVVAVHDGKLVGILTRTDLIERVVATDRDPKELLVADVMSFPIVTVPPTESLVNARRIMDRGRIHQLVVMDDEQVCGIITQTDILRTLKDALLQEEMEYMDEQGIS